MRYSVIKVSNKRMLNRDEAGEYVGVPALLPKMETGGWIKAVRVGPKILLYDVRVLDKCCDRLVAGDLPK